MRASNIQFLSKQSKQSHIKSMKKIMVVGEKFNPKEKIVSK